MRKIMVFMFCGLISGVWANNITIELTPEEIMQIMEMRKQKQDAKSDSNTGFDNYEDDDDLRDRNARDRNPQKRRDREVSDGYYEEYEYPQTRERKPTTKSRKSTRQNPQTQQSQIRQTQEYNETYDEYYDNNQYNDLFVQENPAQKSSNIKNANAKPTTMTNDDVAAEKTGFLLGLGTSIIYSNLTIGNVINEYEFSSIMNDFELQLGFQRFLNPYFGARVYLDLLYAFYGYGTATQLNYPYTYTTDINSNAFDIAGNIDLLIDLPFGENRHMAVGLILGIGYGYISYSADNEAYIANPLYLFEGKLSGGHLNASFGVSFLFFHKNRVELTLKTMFNSKASFMNYGIRFTHTF
ncbi:hypothetical protein CCY99_02435 [Helicobacter sp. 16-1353]|uniref:outer membrane beta-barrel protein n=1 Tax=Helicobacter sp. 16-1353 TaxID=2004996 RepID=UPI000DCBDF7E|nr:outer membrane beta-barrel protein [Helicobacter sp. 16-1353]RAX54640.1 hypothetical protein CCY99_02435 [Helicobacter sp. 16-1353]